MATAASLQDVLDGSTCRLAALFRVRWAAIVLFDDDGRLVIRADHSRDGGDASRAGVEVIRPVDDLPVWSIVCVVVRSGHRRQGVTASLIEGAVAYAASHGAPAVEAHPGDPSGRMDLTMAFVGTRSMFERAGFRIVGTTDAVAGGMPRLVMRRDLV